MPVCAQTDTSQGSAAINTARRILNLLFIFNTATGPLSTTQIITDSDLGYNGANRDSEFKKFRRDRQRLENLGFVIRESKPEGEKETEESRWALDRAASHVDVANLEANDIDTLICAIDEYLGRADVVFREPLLRARTTLSTLTDAPSAPAAGESKTFEALWGAYSSRKQLTFTYSDAHGNQSKRTVSIYGFFNQQNSCYFVGLDDLSDNVRTFRAERVTKVWSPKKSYEVPVDFDIKPYLFLPLDLGGTGDAVADAVFSFPASSVEDELLRLANGRGALSQQADGSWLWSIEQVDVRAAAKMALGYASRGMRPQEPAALIEQWNEILDTAVRNHAA